MNLPSFSPPNTEPANRSRRILLYGFYLITVTALLYWVYEHWNYDDPFITYRYARNLGSGLGPVYNVGERVLSTTTPLFTLLLAPISILTSELSRPAVLIGSASLAFGGLCLWELSRVWNAPAAGWIGLLLYPTFPLVASTLSSETPLYLAFCLGALTLYAHQRFTLTAACAALAVLARPDGVLVPVLIVAHFLVSTWLMEYRQSTGRGRPGLAQNRWVEAARCLWLRLPWRAALVFLALLLPWYLFAWSYYGSPLPVTLNVKQAQGAMPISKLFAEGFAGMAISYSRNWLLRIEAILALVGLGYALFKDRRWLLLLSWTVLYFAAYTLLGVSRYFWYYAPLVPGFIALVGLGAETLSRWVARLKPATVPAAWPQATLGLLVAFTLFLLQGRGVLTTRHDLDARFPVYRELGDWLRMNTSREALIGTIEVGIIGYYADRTMVDFAGLIRPQVAAQLSSQTTYEDAAIWAVENYRPDYIVLPEGAFERLWEGQLSGRCSALKTASGEKYGSKIGPHVIYGCRW